MPLSYYREDVLSWLGSVTLPPRNLLLPNILQYPGRSSQQTSIQSRVSTASRLRACYKVRGDKELLNQKLHFPVSFASKWNHMISSHQWTVSGNDVPHFWKELV